MSSQTFEVFGRPYPWQTPERNRWGTYRHPKLEAWQRTVALSVIAAHPTKIEGPTRLETRTYVPRPKSHTLKSGRLAKGAPVLPTSLRTGDALNHHKGTQDALAGILWEDDRQDVEGSYFLRYADGREPGVVITVSSVEEPPF